MQRHCSINDGAKWCDVAPRPIKGEPWGCVRPRSRATLRVRTRSGCSRSVATTRKRAVQYTHTSLSSHWRNTISPNTILCDLLRASLFLSGNSRIIYRLLYSGQEIVGILVFPTRIRRDVHSSVTATDLKQS